MQFVNIIIFKASLWVNCTCYDSLKGKYVPYAEHNEIKRWPVDLRHWHEWWSIIINSIYLYLNSTCFHATPQIHLNEFGDSLKCQDSTLQEEYLVSWRKQTNKQINKKPVWSILSSIDYIHLKITWKFKFTIHLSHRQIRFK